MHNPRIVILHSRFVVRVSLSFMSTFEDVTAFLRCIVDNFISDHDEVKIAPFGDPLGQRERVIPIKLEGIIVYPVKSCGGMLVPQWRLGPRGFEYDREWMIVEKGGDIINAKKVRILAKLILFNPGA